MNFPGLSGNAALKARLSSSLAAGGLSHAHIIYGEDEGSRLSLAKILASAMVCTGISEKPCMSCRDCRKAERLIHPDIKLVVREKDKRSYGIDIIRDMVQDASVIPNEADKKVYIIPDGDFLTPPCQNAALKVLEEPPKYAAFIILAENPGSFLETLRSRCVELFLSAEANNQVENSAAEDFIRIFRLGDPLAIAAFAVNLEKLDRNDIILFLTGLRDAFVRELRHEEADKRRFFAAVDLIGRLLEMTEANVGTGFIAGAFAVGCNTILK